MAKPTAQSTTMNPMNRCRRRSLLILHLHSGRTHGPISLVGTLGWAPFACSRPAGAASCADWHCPSLLADAAGGADCHYPTSGNAGDGPPQPAEIALHVGDGDST